ncbi:MAG: MerR family transcriptional regulator, partial [Acidobacteria bacterium]|nr:MerR family transcriptional regulator [Acidobacteriota bacterium]
MLGANSQHPTSELDRETGGSYTRREVCRLLKIDGRQLRTWERQRLIPLATQYRFSDLLILKKIAKLRGEKAHPRLIRQALDTIRALFDNLPDSSGDVQVYKDGRRVRIQIGKQKMEPVSGQLLFDFDETEINKLLQLPPTQKSGGAIAEKLRHKIEADYWFERGLELEQTGA